MDTPFQWTKQIASHFGGTRNGMVISWPAHIKDKGGIRPQFHSVLLREYTSLLIRTAGSPPPLRRYRLGPSARQNRFAIQQIEPPPIELIWASHLIALDTHQVVTKSGNQAKSEMTSKRRRRSSVAEPDRCTRLSDLVERAS